MSNLTPTAQTSLNVLRDRILNAASEAEVSKIVRDVHGVFTSEADRISLDARRAADTASRAAASQNQP